MDGGLFTWKRSWGRNIHRGLRQKLPLTVYFSNNRETITRLETFTSATATVVIIACVNTTDTNRSLFPCQRLHHSPPQKLCCTVLTVHSVLYHISTLGVYVLCVNSVPVKESVLGSFSVWLHICWGGIVKLPHWKKILKKALTWSQTNSHFFSLSYWLSSFSLSGGKFMWLWKRERIDRLFQLKES